MQIFEHRVHGIGPEQASAIGEEIKERRAAAMDLGKKAVEVQKNFREMLALVKAQEKIVKALSQVRQSAEARARSIAENLARARSRVEELRQEMEETKLLIALVVILFLLCIVAVTHGISGDHLRSSTCSYLVLPLHGTQLGF
ncbi:uncharacterized protein LOC119359286 [Triticum dicoccoides]|nr:uncharacterized protein LOC119359286 [Triticum dicoccoides]XP_044453073.1 uncharacterized protein LOC123185158 [Triticum aestivum]